ncbi:uncharacterized protein LOC143277849 isoform X2 [Babylonia areolata]|uniref:uncharacterized protein LOC143277849 isoform X2 n=1 Tax=Babylonia areolata TaxID=304850 RepID=UPI003FD3EF2A
MQTGDNPKCRKSESEAVVARRVTGGSRAVCVAVLLGAVCVHAGLFLALSLHTQRRLHSLDLQMSAMQEESHQLQLMVRAAGSLPTGDGDGVSRSNPEKREAVEEDPLQACRQVQKVAKQVCRQEIGQVLKKVADVRLRSQNEAERVAVRRRIDAWVSTAADDMQTRQTTGRRDLEGVFDDLANAELEIFEKYCGNSSKICLPGAKGSQGEKGATGSQGLKGDKGTAGAKGDRGTIGITGPGGSIGAKGDKGEAGSAGARGTKGDTGPTGASGAPGVKGQDGQKGERGFTGPSGSQGPKGDMGHAGTPGVRGQKGEPGVWQPGMDSCCLALTRPTFNAHTQERVTVKEGSSLTLTCGAQGFPPPQVRWEPRAALEGSPRFRVSGGRLTILNTTALGDSRRFTCVASNALGTSGRSFTIRVLHHLVLAPLPRNVTVTENDTLRLECRVQQQTSDPVSVTWYHVTPGGARTEVTSGVSTTTGGSGSVVLTIPETAVRHRGVYVCEVRDELETVNVTETVTVLSRPYITGTSGPTVRAREGEDVVLSCSTDSLPTPLVRWNHDRNDSHVFEDPEGRLHIVDVRKVDAGEYTCTATNNLGADSRTLRVEVQVPPQASLKPELTPLKSSLLFDCLVSGDEPLQVTWLKSGAPLDVSDPGKFIHLPETDAGTPGTRSHRLLVTRAAESDVGIYQCQVNNLYGTARDQSYVYKDMQRVTCRDTFSLCNNSLCGARCPDNCQLAAVPVIGSGSYSVSSSVCKAAVHSGILGEREGGLVLWTIDVTTEPFSAATAHGIHSDASSGGAVEGIAATPIDVDS